MEELKSYQKLAKKDDIHISGADQPRSPHLELFPENPAELRNSKELQSRKSKYLDSLDLNSDSKVSLKHKEEIAKNFNDIL